MKMVVSMSEEKKPSGSHADVFHDLLSGVGVNPLHERDEIDERFQVFRELTHLE